MPSFRVPKYNLGIPEVPVIHKPILNSIEKALVNYKAVSLKDIDYKSFGTFKLRVERAKFLRNLLRVLKAEGRLDHTVELGSGGSTILFGKEVEKSHTAVEHLDWAWERTDAGIETHGLRDKAKVLLKDLDDESGMYKITGADIPDKIDLLLIDGPPVSPKRKGRPRWERWETLPFFLPYLSQDAIVILDSVERSYEQEYLEYWCINHGISFTVPGLTDSRLKGFGIIDPFHYRRK